MPNYWIVPCNIKHFDVVSHFKKNTTVVWKNISSVSPGDIVYIYLGVPYREIRYKCLVLNSNVPEEVLAQNRYALSNRPLSRLYQVEIKYMELELVAEYPEGALQLHDLKENGLGQVQVQAKTNSRLQAFIDQTAVKTK